MESKGPYKIGDHVGEKPYDYTLWGGSDVRKANAAYAAGRASLMPVLKKVEEIIRKRYADRKQWTYSPDAFVGDCNFGDWNFYWDNDHKIYDHPAEFADEALAAIREAKGQK